MLTVKGYKSQPFIGQGLHSLVVQDNQNEDCVVKIVAYSNDFVGSHLSAFHPVNAEIGIAKLLSFTDVCVPIESAVMRGTPFSRQQENSPFLPSNTLKLCRATRYLKTQYRDIVWFLDHYNIRNSDILFRTLLFQLCVILDRIYQTYPTYRHNDLKISNVFIDTVFDPAEDTGTYTWRRHNRTYNVPNSGLRVVLADFDLSSVCGIQDNYNTLEMWMIFTSYGIGFEENHRSDIFRFTTELFYVLENFLSTQLCETLQKLFKNHLGVKWQGNSFYAPDAVCEQDLPTVEEILLCEELFPSVTANTSSRIKLDVTPVVLEDTKEVRLVPLIFPQSLKQTTPSAAHFASLKTKRGLKATLRLRRYRVDREDVKEFYKRSDLLIPVGEISGIVNKINDYLDRNAMPSRLAPLLLIFYGIETLRRLCCEVQESMSIEQWCNCLEALGLLKITQEEFMQILLQWSWNK